MENGNRGLEVWVLRHGEQEGTGDGSYWEPNAPLSGAGRKTIQRVKSTHLTGIKFAIYGTSGFQRARETLDICAVDITSEVMRGLEPVSPAAWDILSNRDPKLADAGIVHLYQHLAGAIILTAEAEHLLNCIKDVATLLDYGEKALLVSHEPLINAALNMARKDWTSQVNLKKGEIIIFQFDRDLNFVGFKHISLP